MVKIDERSAILSGSPQRRHKVKKILVMCLAVCFAVVGISGVASAATKAGDTIISGGISYDMTNLSAEGFDGDISIFTTTIGVGKFFTDSFETEFGLIGQTMTVDFEGDSATQQQLGVQVRPNWHFNTASNTVPYIGLTLGYLWVEVAAEGESESTGAFLYGGQAGSSL